MTAAQAEAAIRMEFADAAETTIGSLRHGDSPQLFVDGRDLLVQVTLAPATWTALFPKGEAA